MWSSDSVIGWCCDEKTLNVAWFKGLKTERRMNHLIIVVDSHDVPLGETGKMPQPHLEHSLGVSQVQEVLNPTGLDNFKRYCVELTFYNC